MDSMHAPILAETPRPQAQPWPLRAVALALLGGIGGTGIYLLLDRAPGAGREPVHYALATFIGVGLLAFAHGWERGRLRRAVGTGVVAGAIVALVFLWNGTPTDDWSGGESWRIIAALLAVFLFVPLAQAAGEGGFSAPPHWSPPGFNAWVRENFDYAAVHDHGWTNLITGGLSVLFAGVFFLMLLLVGELFDLVHVALLKQWLGKGIVIAAIWGAAIGASTALLRDHRRIISALQMVAMTVLRIAAPVLAVALALFLAILPLTGLAPLWDATRSTTPILLSAVLVAVILANSVVGDGAAHAARAPVLRAAALILILVTTPLALVAAISTGLRVGQYGWTPERLWAATFVLLAAIVGFAYLLAAIRGRSGWARALMSANLLLAFLLCGVALLLSTPLVGFDAIAARDQVARLTDGRTRADTFDYHALWFDFGPAGRQAIRHLAERGATAEIRADARRIQGLATRWATDPVADARRRDRALDARLIILPRPVALPRALREALTQYDVCGSDGPCTLRYAAGADVAIVVHDPPGARRTPNAMPPDIILLTEGKTGWARPGSAEIAAHSPDLAGAVRAGRVEIRTESYRRLYIDGRPFDRPFPVKNAVDPARAP